VFRRPVLPGGQGRLLRASDTEKARALLAKISVELAEVQRLLG
jgi:hypothetical protein